MRKRSQLEGRTRIDDNSTGVLSPCSVQMLDALAAFYIFNIAEILGRVQAGLTLSVQFGIKHDGSRPMNITWQLRAPIPAKFLKKTNKLVVG